MLQKIMMFLFVIILSCTQFVIAQEKSNTTRPVLQIDRFNLGTPEQEKQLNELIKQCFLTMNYKYQVPRDHDPEILHPLEEHVRICSVYSVSSKFGFSSDESSVTKEQKEQINEIYKKLYLVIWKANLINVLYPKMPNDFVKEFDDFSGFNAFKNQKEYLKKRSYDKLTDAELAEYFFGSKIKRQQITNMFLKRKSLEYGLGE